MLRYEPRQWCSRNDIALTPNCKTFALLLSTLTYSAYRAALVTFCCIVFSCALNCICRERSMGQCRNNCTRSSLNVTNGPRWVLIQTVQEEVTIHELVSAILQITIS